jgi:hypothetical protein
LFWNGTVLLRRICLRALLSLLVLALCTSLFPSTAAGQWFNHDPDLYGYVTAVHSPTSFDVDLVPVTTAAGTTYGLFGDKNPTANSPLRNAIRVGVYVHVSWLYDDSKKKSPAVTVLLRDDWDKQLSGVGVIDRVIATGAEPVFEADGYRIRIAQGTQVRFKGRLRSLADVGTSVLVRFEGKRDNTGDLVADKAEFTVVDPNKFGSVPAPVGQKPVPSGGAIMGVDGKLESPHAKVRYQESGDFCGWFRVPDNPALQERVRRVGMRLVPASQKQLPADSPFKIDFRFYAVDQPDFHTDLFCTAGLVMVPKQVVERLETDDELAAVLADGIAANFQMPLTRFLANDTLSVSTKMGEVSALIALGNLASAKSTAIFSGVGIGLAIAEDEIEVRIEEQRDRMALALLADAGYDPRQQPEAWRLLTPRKLPKDMSRLPYPSRCGYQLSILNLQYGKSGSGTVGN